jgi:hypothetical protein
MSNAVAVHGQNAAAVSMEQMQRMAKSITASRMFGCKTEDEAMAIMLLAQAEGLHPASAARDYHVIQGRPAMKADAMLSRYLQSGGKVEWITYTDTKVEGKFTHPQGGSVTVDWTPDRAKQAGLLGKDNWKHYTRQMLRARVISEGVRTTNPGIASGIYTVEEVQDMAEQEHQARVERDMGTVEVVREDWEKAINAAQTLGELGEIWAHMSADEKKQHAATKDARKAALSKPAPPDDFVADMEAEERTV